MSSATWRLYVILDPSAAGGRDLAEVAREAIRGGADVLQLREKTSSDKAVAAMARRVLALARPAGIPLIINDRVQVAKAVGADGVHVGQEDWPVARAREVLGPGRLIGKSTHSLAQAMAAEAEGADYIGFGPLFATSTKPNAPAIGTAAIGAAAARVQVPIVCIGGIEPGTLDEALHAGARCVAVVRAVCAAPDPEAAARELKARMRQFDRANSARHL